MMKPRCARALLCEDMSAYIQSLCVCLVVEVSNSSGARFPRDICSPRQRSDIGQSARFCWESPSRRTAQHEGPLVHTLAHKRTLTQPSGGHGDHQLCPIPIYVTLESEHR